MRCLIEHWTRYRFTEAVRLGRHTVRLRPRDGAGRRLEGFELRVEPGPVRWCEALDVEGNGVRRLWWGRPVEGLVILTRAVVVTEAAAAFEDLLPREAGRLARVYDADLAARLGRYRQGTDGEAVAAMGHRLAAEAGQGTLAFLGGLTRALHEGIRSEPRAQGGPRSAEQTLECGVGACRDLTVVFMEVCRAVGLAARFVSGYHVGEPGLKRPEMHAWAEVYLPVVGWRGYDPAQGRLVTDRHVPVAASRDPAGADPVAGTYFGEAGVELSHEIRFGF